MKNYINPELTVVSLNEDDVIRTSNIGDLLVDSHGGDSYSWGSLTGSNT